MNAKILETNSQLPDVMLYRDTQPDSANPIVIIQAWGKQEDEEGDDTQVVEVVGFESPETAKRFIADYTVPSAENWCKTQKIAYA